MMYPPAIRQFSVVFVYCNELLISGDHVRQASRKLKQYFGESLAHGRTQVEQVERGSNSCVILKFVNESTMYHIQNSQDQNDMILVYLC